MDDESLQHQGWEFVIFEPKDQPNISGPSESGVFTPSQGNVFNASEQLPSAGLDPIQDLQVDG
jgi:hypothetical protein